MPRHQWTKEEIQRGWDNMHSAEGQAKLAAVRAESRALRKQAFLNAYQQHYALQGVAAKASHVHLTTVREWLGSDDEFKRQYEEIETYWSDALRSYTMERAMSGKSDLLTIAELRRRDVGYRESSQNISGPVTINDNRQVNQVVFTMNEVRAAVQAVDEADEALALRAARSNASRISRAELLAEDDDEDDE